MGNPKKTFRRVKTFLGSLSHFHAKFAQSILLEANQRRRLGYLQVICGHSFGKKKIYNFVLLFLARKFTSVISISNGNCQTQCHHPGCKNGAAKTQRQLLHLFEQNTITHQVVQSKTQLLIDQVIQSQVCTHSVPPLSWVCFLQGPS